MTVDLFPVPHRCRDFGDPLEFETETEVVSLADGRRFSCEGLSNDCTARQPGDRVTVTGLSDPPWVGCAKGMEFGAEECHYVCRALGTPSDEPLGSDVDVGDCLAGIDPAHGGDCIRAQCDVLVHGCTMPRCDSTIDGRTADLAK